MDKKLVLGVDFNNMFFASSYGEALMNSKGMNVNAIKGFFFKIKALKESLNPDYIVFANDISRERTFRRKLFKPYKAQRKSHDQQIMDQMKYASRLSALIGYPFINNEIYEADDILGMISKYTSEHDMDFVIASSDKDMYQLVSDNTFVFSPRNKEMIDPSWLYEKYHLTPAQWIELKMLQGDRSDNIPGIDGIGEVTALKLMQQFHSIEGIYNHLGSLKPSLKETLQRGEKVLPLTRELVTIVTDYTKIGLTGEMLDPKESFVQEVFELINELEIYSLYNVMSYSLLTYKQFVA